MKTMLPHRLLQTLSPKRGGRAAGGRRPRLRSIVDRRRPPPAPAQGLRPRATGIQARAAAEAAGGSPGLRARLGGSLGWSGRPWWRWGEWWVCAERRARRSLTLDTIFLSWLSDPAMAAASRLRSLQAERVSRSGAAPGRPTQPHTDEPAPHPPASSNRKSASTPALPLPLRHFRGRPWVGVDGLGQVQRNLFRAWNCWAGIIRSGALSQLPSH